LTELECKTVKDLAEHDKELKEELIKVIQL